MAAALPVSPSGGDARAEDKESNDPELREFPDDVLREKKLRLEKMLDGGTDNICDGGTKLRAFHDAICRELARRSEGPRPRGGGPEARAQDEKVLERVVQSRGAESSGMASFGKDAKEDLYIDNSTKMEYNGHNQVCMPALKPSHKRKGDNSVRFSMRLRSSKGEVVLVDGDMPHPDSAEVTSNRSPRKLYYPTREHPHSIEISSDDINCLNPESLLTSHIMNFYIMYLQGPTQSTVRPRSDYHIFNTYFFIKLESLKLMEDQTTCFSKLRRWWKGIDIFRKAYLLLPVHKDTHWSLVIICMPAKEDQRGPLILHLDSLKFHSSKLIFNIVSRFLKAEWSFLNKNASLTEYPLQETVWKNLPRKIEKKKIEVPQQENEFDCGVFTLYFMQRFIQEAPERLHKKDLSMFGKKSFGPEDASQFRLEIRHLILSCAEAEQKDDVTE